MCLYCILVSKRNTWEKVKWNVNVTEVSITSMGYKRATAEQYNFPQRKANKEDQVVVFMGGGRGQCRDAGMEKNLDKQHQRDEVKKTGTPFHTFKIPHTHIYTHTYLWGVHEVKAGVEGHICRLTLFSDIFEETSCIKGNPSCQTKTLVHKKYLFLLVCMSVRHMDI